VSSRPTRQVIDVRGNSTFTERGDGSWLANFDVLGVTGEGATADLAWQALREALMAKINEGDEQVRETWQKFAEAHVIEQEIPEEELRAQREIIERSHEASAGFEVLDLQTIDGAMARQTPVLVDFWAEWCMPCHMQAPVLKEAADALAGRMTVAKMNVDDNKEAWERFGIEGIPTMILFARGGEIARVVGAGRTLEAFLAELEPHLA
jgi:thioredoxin 1